MKVLFILIFVSIQSTLACSPDFSSCKIDSNHFIYTSTPDDLSSDFPAEAVDIKFSDQTIYLSNLTKEPLYILESGSKPNITIKNKKWFIYKKRYASNQKFSCEAANESENLTLEQLDGLKWDCSEQRDSCESTHNPNYVEIYHSSFDFGKIEEKFLTTPVLPQKKLASYTGHYLYKGNVHTLKANMRISVNPDYLKVTCEKGIIISECGEGCWNLESKSYYSNSDANYEKLVSEFEIFSLKNKLKYKFQYEVIINGKLNEIEFNKRLKTSLLQWIDQSNIAQNSENAILAIIFNEYRTEFHGNEVNLRLIKKTF